MRAAGKNSREKTAGYRNLLRALKTKGYPIDSKEKRSVLCGWAKLN